MRRASMPTTKKKLTDKLVSDLQPKAERYELQDTDEPALRVRVAPSGVKSFCVLYRVRGSRRLNRYTLGAAGDLTVTEYRAKAGAIVSDARTNGIDAAAALRARKAVPTVAALGKDYLDHCADRLKPKTVDGYRSSWRTHIAPTLGSMDVCDVTTVDVAALHRGLRLKPYAANRVLALLASFFAYTITHGYRAKLTNPTDEVTAYKEKARERFLTRHELAKLLAALDTAESVGLPPAPRKRRPTKRAKKADAETKIPAPRAPASVHVVGALRFLLLTGWREQEVMTLRWDAVNDARDMVTLQDTKTDKSHRPLSAAAAALLESLPRVSRSPFVFPSPLSPSRPIADVGHLWKAVRHAAGLQSVAGERRGVRLHDIRHSAASFAIGAGASLPVIGKMLGHKHTATTARYAHLTADPVRAAMDSVAAAIDAARSTTETSVTPITSKKRRTRSA